jgi:MFS family permease
MTIQNSGKTFSAESIILDNMESTLNVAPVSLTAKHWLILVTAGLGFAFDLYETVVMAIVVRPVLTDLGPFHPGTPQFNTYAGLLLFIPVVIGGLASLLGGYLTDRLGRQRVLVWSIVIYGVAAFLAGFSTSLAELMFWRSITVAGACVEYVAAIAWLTELFPDRRRREGMLGFAQACAAGGNFMIAGAYFAAVTWGDHLPEILGAHSAWRYTLIFGALPAIPLMLVRPFLPESPVWQAKKLAGTLQRPGFSQLFSPQLRRVTVVTTVLIACGYALAYGMLQHIPRVVPGLPKVAELSRQAQEQWVSWVHVHVDMGALAGRLLLVALAVYLVRRRPLLRGILCLSLVLIPLTLLGPALHDADLFKYAVLMVSVLVSLQYSFWGNYLPRVYPLHLRGTGEVFAFSIGGRVLAPLAAIATTQLSNVTPGATPAIKLASAMALVAVTATVFALLVSRWLPEPPEALPED